ncbi:MAG: hypothetical protein J5793_03795, partial [Clostridia bacterium]|nr:hypothetical protein [Clostridia bacterium]
MPEKKNSEMMISAEAQKGSNIPQKTNKPSKDAAKVRAKRQVRASDMHAVRSIQVVSVKKSDKKPFPWAVVFVALILTAMFLFMMMNYAEVDKYRSEIADLDSKIESMQKTQGNLEVALSSKYNL